MINKMKHIVSRFDPKRAVQTRASKRAIMKFSEDNGLVYFGHVHQQDDDHHLIRGVTLSTSHRDNHYSIGSTNSYDVTLVERRDNVHLPDGSSTHHQWLIFAFDLHTTSELPHIFIGHNRHSAQLYNILSTKFNRLQKAAIGTFGTYDPSFVDNYSVFTEVAESLSAERLFSHDVAKTIAAHFGSLSIELAENCLYLYSDRNLINAKLLTTMLKNGLWLASSLDKNAEHI